jgi:hypothetical protein
MKKNKFFRLLGGWLCYFDSDAPPRGKAWNEEERRKKRV